MGLVAICMRYVHVVEVMESEVVLEIISGVEEDRGEAQMQVQGTGMAPGVGGSL